MIEPYKNKATIGVLIGMVISGGAMEMRRHAESETHGLIYGLIGCGFCIWGGVNYARAKGHSSWWGVFGLFGLLGMIPIAALRDRCADGQPLRKVDASNRARTLSARDEAFLFPSDIRSLPPAVPVGAAPVQALQPAPVPVTHRVTFGSAFAVDGFDFVREGTITIEGPKTVYEGNRKRSILLRTGLFLLITIAPIAVLPFGVMLVPAFYFVNYLWTKRCSLMLASRGITGLQRKGRKIQFSAPDPQTGRLCTADISLVSEQNAAALERDLSRSIAFPLDASRSTRAA